MGKLVDFIKKETVLCVSAVLAFISAFFVPVSKEYLSYIDFGTLSLLLCLMAVMAGFRKIGVFSLLTKKLIDKVSTLRQIVFILVMLCFFFSMAVTNDVALITFVPFAIEVLTQTGHRKHLIFVIVLQTIAANLGSMLTPVGNPQNLYLYSVSGMDALSFIKLMAPYTVVSFVLLVICILFIRNEKVSVKMDDVAEVSRKGVVFYIIMFAVSLMAVAKILPIYAVLAVVVASVLVFDRRVLKDVDYSLLLTFVFFFVFIGNMGNVEQFRNFVNAVLEGNEVITSVLASQCMSNVPAALLLSGFTDKYELLVIGTNLGGLGTLIASMASLISYKYVVNADGGIKGKYMAVFTVMNIVFLAILLGVFYVI